MQIDLLSRLPLPHPLQESQCSILLDCMGIFDLHIGPRLALRRDEGFSGGITRACAAGSKRSGVYCSLVSLSCVHQTLSAYYYYL